MNDELVSLIGRLDLNTADAEELYAVADELARTAEAIRTTVSRRLSFEGSVADLLALATDAHDALEQQADVLDEIAQRDGAAGGYALTQEVDGVVDVDDEQEDVA